jgi:hypothetical protein
MVVACVREGCEGGMEVRSGINCGEEAGLRGVTFSRVGIRIINYY